MKPLLFRRSKDTVQVAGLANDKRGAWVMVLGKGPSRLSLASLNLLYINKLALSNENIKGLDMCMHD